MEVVGQAADAPSALALCAEHEPTVAFCDLRMPGPDGIALAESLLARYPSVAVVVVSAHDDGAIAAFEARVLDYLLKPVRLERLQRTIARLSGATVPSGSSEPISRVAVRRRGALVVLDIATVVFFEVKDELVWAVTGADRFALDLTLAALEERLPSGEFFRCHRGALVRLSRIRAMEPTGAGTYDLVLDHPDGLRVPLARERARALREIIPIAG